MKAIDFKFGIKPRSWRIAHLLEESALVTLKESDFYKKIEYEISTYPFYNGRESSICLVICPSFLNKEALFVVFGEHRNSDDTFVDIWEGTKPPYNGPKLEDFTDEAYENRKTFSYKDDYEVDKYIYWAIKNFLNKFIEDE